LSQDSEPGRRLLLASGTAHFDHLSPDATLCSVPAEVQRITDAFSVLGYERFPGLSLNPSISDLRENLPKWFQTLMADDIAVFYYTSHGTHDDDRFYLFTRDSKDGILDTTSLPAEELARWIAKNSHAKQFLVILDACFSGHGASDFLTIASKFSNVVGAKGAFFVIAAARPKQEAAQGVLASALSVALANIDSRFGGATQRFLAMEDVMEAVDEFLIMHSPRQTATWSSANVRGRSLFFPNPRYHPLLQPGLDLEIHRALLEHWIPKATGAEIGAVGWYFTGRRTALDEILSWLSGDLFDDRVRVVTGGPGSGKSALLARIVTLSDPATRIAALSSENSIQLKTGIVEGLITVAIHARRKTLTEIVRLVADQLNIPASNPAELLEAFKTRNEKAVVILDALDEAENPNEVVLEILKPLSALSNILLLIGTRPDSTQTGRRFQALGASTVEIDLDQPRYFNSGDVVLYVQRRLLCEEEPARHTPYRDKPDLARAVATAVAVRSGKVFLVARTVIQSLIALENPVDTSLPGWIENLPTGIEDAFEQFLSGFDLSACEQVSSAVAKAVLMPLAYAEGEGLPWVSIWSRVAAALSGILVTDSDIAQVLRRAAPFIVEAQEANQSVYRLYHEEFVRYLRAQCRDAEPESTITLALLALVPSENGKLLWDKVHQPYILNHLSTHAAKVSGLLDAIIVDPCYLVRADPVRLLASINRSEGNHSISGVAQEMRGLYRLGHHYLRQTLNPDERAAYLELRAHMQGSCEAMKAFGRLEIQSAWRVRWAHSQPKRIHVTLEGHTSSVNSVAIVEVDNGRRLIVSGGSDSIVRVWDLEAAIPIGVPFIGHGSSVNSVAVGKLRNGRRVVVSGSNDCTVRVWDLETGVPVGELR